MSISDHDGNGIEKQVTERVCKVVREVLAIEGQIDLDASIVDDLAPESLDQVRLFMTLEDEFQGTIPDEEIENIGTLSQVIVYIRNHIIQTRI